MSAFKDENPIKMGSLGILSKVVGGVRGNGVSPSSVCGLYDAVAQWTLWFRIVTT